MRSALMQISVAALLFFLLESMAGGGVSRKTLRFGLGVVLVALILESFVSVFRGW